MKKCAEEHFPAKQMSTSKGKNQERKMCRRKEVMFLEGSVHWRQRERGEDRTQVRRDHVCPTKEWGPHTLVFPVPLKVYKEKGELS